jgi:hypothetical protein
VGRFQFARSARKATGWTATALFALAAVSVACFLPHLLRGEETIRERVLRLLTEIHSTEKVTSDAAERELAEIGIQDDRLQFARLLKHPDRAARLRLVQQLNDIDEPLQSDLRTELLVDSDRSVRAAVIGALTADQAQGAIGERLKELQRTERDPVVRQRIQQLLDPGSVSEKPATLDPSKTELTAPASDRVRGSELLPATQLPATPWNLQPDSEPTPRPEDVFKFDDPNPGSAPAERSESPGTLPTPPGDDQESELPILPVEIESGLSQPVPAQRPAARTNSSATGQASAVETNSQPPAIQQLSASGVGTPPTPLEVEASLPEPAEPSLTIDELFQQETLSPLEKSGRKQRVPGRNPEILDRPLDESLTRETQPGFIEQAGGWVTPEPQAPYGFSGQSGILPSEVQESAHFVPQEDRWRNGYDKWDRYGEDHPWVDDYPGVEGHWWDPYNQNVIKGDYPIIGQHTFFNLTATNLTQFDYRQSPAGTTPFESTRASNQQEFFGNNNQTFLNSTLFLRMDLFHGNQTGFKPIDWMLRVTPTVNMNQLHVDEIALVNPDVRYGRTRHRDHFVLQEYFAEAKIADISPDYDFASVRVGNQFFNSDFRGFIFFDTNRAVRLFGSRLSNRHQFNLLFYDMVEKETNSGLNTTSDRHQNVLIANYYIQDFVFPGYTFQTSFHWNNDQPSMKFDRNDFRVRPDPAGVFQKHRVESYYFGIAGDGHMGRINVNNAFYWATGRDSLNPIAGQPMDINAYMAAIELSYDRDWARFRASFFWSSGDDNPNDNDGEGFDSIIDNPAFAGGEFSYWQRQAIQLFGVRLVNDRSLVPDLRSSGIQGQSNFTNPGLFLFNLGMDLDLTPKLRMIMNANYLMFDETEVLSAFTFQGDVDNEIGVDLSCGFEWRPFHNDNAIMLFGVSALIPDEGFKDLYAEFNDGDTDTLFASFFEMILTY